MEKDAQDRVPAGSLHNESCQPAVVLSLIPQGLYQLQQVVPKLIVVHPFQGLYCKAPDLRAAATFSQRLLKCIMGAFVQFTSPVIVNRAKCPVSLVLRGTPVEQ